MDIFGGLLSAIGMLFGKLMYFIYNTIGFHNYALSIVFFTIVYKVLLLPLTMKQMKSSAKMQELQPELARIQERYKNDKEKLNEETMKFYQEKGYNPAGGCLPLLVQMPIIIALFYVIRMPMSYMLEIPARAVGEMAIVSVQSGNFELGQFDKDTFEKIKDNPTEVYTQLSKKDYYFEVRLLDAIKKDPAVIEKNEFLNAEQKAVLNRFNFKMFNVFNFGINPTIDFKTIAAEPGTYIPPLILLLLAVLTTYFSSMLLMPPTPAPTGKDKKAPNAGCAGKSMLWISPIMTLWIGLTTPSGLSFYWTINNILSFIQQKSLNKIYKKDKKEDKEEKNIVKVDSKGSKNNR
jgi:YidC/Oxa1 family membrane protein insertase